MSETLFNRIDTVFLPVRDLEQAVAWYTGILHVSLLWQAPGVACLKLGETPLTLLQGRFPGLAERGGQDFTFQPVSEPGFNFYTADIAHAHRILLEQGVDVGAILDHGDVKEFQFFDPDGNLLSVCGWQE